MPANVVKTPRDEKLWSKAKKLAQKKKLTGDRRWAYTMGIFNNMKGEGEKEMLQDEELQIESLLRNFVHETLSCSESSSS